MRSAWIPGSAAVLLLAGCYSPQVVDGATDSAASMSTSDGSTTATDTSAPTGMPTTVDPSMSTAPSTTADPDTTTADTELGPRIVMSIPADGDLQAPLGEAFGIYFDRVVGIDDAVGHIFVSQGGGEPVPISPMPCPPDADPTCVLGFFPAAFLDEDTGTLPGGTAHTIIVDAGFADPDGNLNTLDQIIAFTTFEYELDFFDDSDAFTNEFGGLAFAGDGALYLGGERSGGGGCTLRRVALVDGAPQAAETAATPVGSSLCYGVDAFDDRIYLAGSYSSTVYRYDDGPGDLTATLLEIAAPDLAPPLDDLDEVWSTAPLHDAAGGVLFAHGEFVGGVENTSILRWSNASVWSEWHSGAGLWDDASGVVVASGMVAGSEVVFVLADGQIFSFSPDATLIAQAELESYDYDSSMRIDGHGRVWIGSYGGVHALDPETFEVLAEREGFRASRIALREDGDTVHVYFAAFRESAVIGHVAVDF